MYFFKSALFSLVTLTGQFCLCWAQTTVSKADVESHLRFLSSDELQGRKTGEIGADVAARYIAEQFRRNGVLPAPGASNYLQQIPFKKVTPPEQVSIEIGDSSLIDLADVILISKLDLQIESPVIFANFASDSDLEGMDVEGKIVLARLGNENTSGAQEGFQYSKIKRKNVLGQGAVALLEIYHGRLPWNLIKNYLGQERTVVAGDANEASLTHLVINRELNDEIAMLENGADLLGKVRIEGGISTVTPSANVIGYIEGSDPQLKEQYIVLSAHYDHVGMRSRPDKPETGFDSIFNGARDNAFGVSALLTAGEYLAAQPPRRSILLVAFTGEEIGLLGSKYFVENPIVPLNQMVFNLNTDGAGYNDTTIISIMGLNRVGAHEELTQACHAYGLEPFADPAPNQGLFDRSDNVSFAKVGIPAPTFSPGFREFDQTILENYHQPSDEVSGLDFNYVHKFCRAFALAARLIADKTEQPRWSLGDKYEKAFEDLYNSN